MVGKCNGDKRFPHRKSDGVSWLAYDARGIPIGYVCNKCEEAKKSRFRTDIFTDDNYYTDEPIDYDY
jgi:hypothetical protein